MPWVLKSVLTLPVDSENSKSVVCNAASVIFTASTAPPFGNTWKSADWSTVIILSG